MTNKPFLIRITSYSPIFALVGFFIWLADLVLRSFENSSSDVVKITIPLILYLFTRYAFFYNVITDSFKPLSEVSQDYTKFISDDPELVIVHVNVKDSRFGSIDLPHGAHVIPLRNLIAGDMILSINSTKKYSLSFCLLFNSIHAYLLPFLDGKQIEISSNQGSMLNGNKVLTDKRGKFIWQQFNGKLIHNSTNKKVNDLIDIRITRAIWSHTMELYRDALFYHRKVNFSIYFFFRSIGKLVKNFNHLGFSRGGTNTSLKKKIPIIGISIIGEGQKAYPYEMFNPNEISILEDKIGTIEFSFIFNGLGAYAYKITGLHFEDNLLNKEEKSWSLNGVANGEYENLVPLHITEHAYWYLWNKFYPNTEIYKVN
ncbi:MAG: hypothetical protein HeimC2_02350 [Candidatus Heimdallarchaeota archaeon LC_2]|nr:MAG: hypothetical protein HeimC2_02350 [Candidatus Heimdallarchaeota archaeon LC_2]